MSTATKEAITNRQATPVRAARLEHVNITASDPDRTAAMFCELFDWHIRWDGASLGGGRSIHVGTDEQYIAIYRPASAPESAASSYGMVGGLNHVAVVVDDIDEMETRVRAAGFSPDNFGDYEPGRRFYFWDHDNIEYEVVSYQ